MLQKIFKRAKSFPDQTGTSDIFSKARDFETTRIFDLEEKARRLIRNSYIHYAVIICLTIAICSMLPLKEVQYFLITQNEITGKTEMVGSLQETALPKNEARDKGNLANYVEVCESYNYWRVQEDLHRCLANSAPAVEEQQTQRYKGPNARNQIFHNHTVIQTEVLSVVLGDRNTGTVRFKTKTIKNNDKTNALDQFWVANLTYDYYPKMKMTIKDRWRNHLGFQVLSYQISPEVSFGGESE